MKKYNDIFLRVASEIFCFYCILKSTINNLNKIKYYHWQGMIQTSNNTKKVAKKSNNEKIVERITIGELISGSGSGSL
jgi:hypothetical protein